MQQAGGVSRVEGLGDVETARAVSRGVRGRVSSASDPSASAKAAQGASSMPQPTIGATRGLAEGRRRGP